MSAPDPPPLVLPGRPPARPAEPELAASVALLVHDDAGGIQVGSAVLVAVGHRFLVATAAHNLEGIPSDRWIRVLPRGRYRGDPIRFSSRSRGRWEGLDVAWIELEAAVVERRALEFLRLEDLTPGAAGAGGTIADRIEVEHLWVHGYGAHGVDARGLLGTRFTLEATTVRSVRMLPGHGVVGYRRRTDLAVAWPPPDRAVPVPAGLSGGAIWSGASNRAGLAALTRSWNRSRGLLLATRIEHWLLRVWTELPDVRPAVESVLCGARP